MMPWSTAAAYPAIAEALWRDCMVDAAVLAQWVVNVGGGVIQMQLADVTGLTAVHVNRTLQGLRRDGPVSPY